MNEVRTDNVSGDGEALSYIFRFHTAQDKKFANQLPGIFPITVMVVIAW
jgi:hypothetical protein